MRRTRRCSGPRRCATATRNASNTLPIDSYWGGRSLWTTLSPIDLEERAMFRDQPSIPLGPIGVDPSSLTRRKCCRLLMLAPIGMVVPSLRGTTAPIQENVDRAEGDRKALDDFLEAYR